MNDMAVQAAAPPVRREYRRADGNIAGWRSSSGKYFRRGEGGPTGKGIQLNKENALGLKKKKTITFTTTVLALEPL